MKIYYICECCDEVFNMANLGKQNDPGQAESLTRKNLYAIINRESERNNNYYVYSICPDCREDIQGGDETLFYREPLIN